MEKMSWPDPGEGNIYPSNTKHGTSHKVRAVDPTVRVKCLNRYVPEISFEKKKTYLYKIKFYNAFNIFIRYDDLWPAQR